MRSIWLAISLVFLLAPTTYSQVSEPAQPEGRVIGIVFDEQGPRGHSAP